MNPRTTDRRQLLKGGLVAPLALDERLIGASTSGGARIFAADRLLTDVKAYAAAGNKCSGGAGDRRTADWIAGRLTGAGFTVERQAFEVPWFETTTSELILNEIRIPLVTQPIVIGEATVELTAPLRLWETAERLDGAIAVVRLPYRRWSSMGDRAVSEPISNAISRGASAVLLVTTGPSGEALLLNVRADRPASDRPIALLAPRLAAPVVEAARFGRVATLRRAGRGGQREAENVVGRIVRAGRPWCVVSTPRSGWTSCVGERGPGIAIWLALAAWMPRAFPRHSLLFVCTSGHEFENLGASKLAGSVAPPTADTDLWLHLGANVATRDYQETPGRLLPLPSADPYRFLVTSEQYVARARQIFAGQPGIEVAYPSADGSAGELSEVIKAGYRRHVGVFGAHRHHHADSDDLSTVAPLPLAAAARGFRDLLTSILSPSG